MENAKLGTPYLVFTQLQEDGLYPVAIIKNPDRLIVCTLNLNPVGNGLYENFYNFSIEGAYTVTFKNYKNPERTVEDLLYETVTESVLVEESYILAESVADSVWNRQMSEHSINGSFGLNFQVIKQNTVSILGELLSPSTGLSKLKDEIINNTVSISNKIDTIRSDILQIIPAIDTAKNSVISQVDQNEQLILNVYNQNSANQLAVEQLFTNENSKLVELKQLITSLSNNTTVRFIVPERLILPADSEKTYQFHLRLYDDLGNPEAPDITPTLIVKSLSTGVTLRSGAMTSVVGQTGAYYYDYTIAPGTLLDVILVEVKITEGGVDKYVPAVSEIVEFESDLQEINNKLTSANAKLDTGLNAINSSQYGLQSLKEIADLLSAKSDTIITKENALAGSLSLIPTDVASSGDIESVLNAISNNASLAQIQNLLYNMQSAIMGSSGKTITEVFQKIDFTSLLQKNDPRLANLDAPISSRGTLTASQVWQYAQRTLTEINIPISDFQKMWDFSLSYLTTPGSIGKRIAEYLDTKVSSRATAAQVQAGLEGVAQEISVQHVIGQMQQQSSQDMIDMRTLVDFLTTIRTKTNYIPSAPATESRVAYAESNLTNLIQNLSLVVSVIKTYASRIPAVPATEQSVLAIDDSLLRSDDPRLSNLDVKVSSRAAAIDTTPLAHKTDLALLQSAVLGVLLDSKNAVLLSMQDFATISLLEQKIYSVLTSIAQAKGEIIDNIPAPQGTTLSAKAIWEYATRTITNNIDISNLATKTDVQKNDLYDIAFSTVVRPSSNDQEVIVWPTKNNQRIIGSDCAISVKNSSGIVLWSASLSTPNTDGVFRFIHELVVVEDQNYYINIDIKVDGAVRTSRQPFFTVGI